MSANRRSFRDALEARAQVVRDAFGLPGQADLLSAPLARFQIGDDVVRRLEEFNIEWHVIPSTTLVAFDDAYLTAMYPRRAHDFDSPAFETPSLRQMLVSAHASIQGTIVGIETTQKPVYQPDSAQQFYGTTYGLDPTSDPLRGYIDEAGLKSGPRFVHSRFAHTPGSLRTLGEIINNDWTHRGLIPPGYRLYICPPTVFNLVGLLFHPEWSDAATLELSAFINNRDDSTGLAVGSNERGDFSFVRRLDVDPDLSRLGFRVALVPRGD